MSINAIMTMQWLSMESAPKDRPIILKVGGIVREGFYDHDLGMWCSTDGQTFTSVTPDGWMPLPDSVGNTDTTPQEA